VTGSLVDPVSGREIAGEIVRASGPLGRTFGLLGRAALEAGEGMWFDGSASVHTFGMRTCIDVVFVAADGTIVATFERLPPWRLAAARGARDVVELAPGTCARAAIRTGMKIEMVWPSST
jgi:uncharacterized protein